ncbi:TIGR02186 family protein [Rhodobacter ferrooxidans]|uniref:Transmembrane protein n=1 Tax=Rhodobacter ferrooxidans TaxID=371731 RepID=C8RXM4_9RHOB|nr:TIGR02186 family protein [Rhodobacter sp. SW2]EEW26749.1 conserved hypothetical protein [Rhodobacter sp. SW2]
MIRALALLMLMALPVAAQTGPEQTRPEQPRPEQTATETIVAGLSHSRVSITTNFGGSEILIYGAVKRETKVPEGPPLQVIITVEGPPQTQIVRRKDHRFGIWLNSAEVRIDSAPSFYAVASTGPLSQILAQTDDLRYNISLPQAIRAVGISAEAESAPQFVEALMRIRTGEGRFMVRDTGVGLAEDTLFRADIELPANLTEGNYQVRIFLTRDGAVVDTLKRTIRVRKEGLERTVYRMATRQPLLYGLIALALAAVSGWAASAVFRLFRL